MHQFIAWSDPAGLAMSFYDATNMPEGRLAQQYVLADNFFHAAFGGSFLNHFWLACACTPRWPDAPDALRAQLDAGGMLVKDGPVTPDGYAVNTTYSVNQPHPAEADPRGLLRQAARARQRASGVCRPAARATACAGTRGGGHAEPRVGGDGDHHHLR